MPGYDNGNKLIHIDCDDVGMRHGTPRTSAMNINMIAISY
jgi:hypothetical protein